MEPTCSRRMLALAGRARDVLDRAARRELVAFLSGCFNPDGGARGRESVSDLYYTLFAAGSLQALGARPPRRKALRYIRSFGTGDRQDFVHRACLARLHSALPSTSATRARILHGLEAWRAEDGGFHHLDRNGTTSSVYGSFLAFLAYEDLGQPLAGVEGLAATVFTQLGPSSNTNSLAAGVCLLQQVGQAPPGGIGDWLLDRLAPTGGFKAHAEAPAGDLLSTATSLLALHLLGTDFAPLRDACLASIESCWQNNGGFGGYAADVSGDAEYTFYALLSLGCLLA